MSPKEAIATPMTIGIKQAYVCTASTSPSRKKASNTVDIGSLDFTVSTKGAVAKLNPRLVKMKPNVYVIEVFQRIGLSSPTPRATPKNFLTTALMNVAVKHCNKQRQNGTGAICILNFDVVIARMEVPYCGLGGGRPVGSSAPVLIHTG